MIERKGTVENVKIVLFMSILSSKLVIPQELQVKYTRIETMSSDVDVSYQLSIYVVHNEFLISRLHIMPISKCRITINSGIQEYEHLLQETAVTLSC